MLFSKLRANFDAIYNFGIDDSILEKIAKSI